MNVAVVPPSVISTPLVMLPVTAIDWTVPVESWNVTDPATLVTAMPLRW